MRFLIVSTLTAVMAFTIAMDPAQLRGQAQPISQCSDEPFGPPSDGLQFQLPSITRDLLSDNQLNRLQAPRSFDAGNSGSSTRPASDENTKLGTAQYGSRNDPMSETEARNPLRRAAAQPMLATHPPVADPIPFEAAPLTSRVQQVAFQEPAVTDPSQPITVTLQTAPGVPVAAASEQPPVYGPALPPEMERRLKEQTRVSSLDVDSLIADIDRKQESVRTGTDLDEDKKNLSLNALNKAADTAHMAKQWQSERQKIETRIQQFESDLSTVQSQLAQPVEPPALLENLPTDEFENRLRMARTDLGADTDDYNKILDEIKHQAKQRCGNSGRNGGGSKASAKAPFRTRITKGNRRRQYGANVVHASERDGS